MAGSSAKSWTVEQPFARASINHRLERSERSAPDEPWVFKVLSLLTFFAPAKKVSRLRDEIPPAASAVRTQDREKAPVVNIANGGKAPSTAQHDEALYALER